MDKTGAEIGDERQQPWRLARTWRIEFR